MSRETGRRSPPVPDELRRLEAARELQRRDAARGCLLALVLEGAALLGGLAWLVALATRTRWLRVGAATAFLGFTAAAAAVIILMILLGNRPAARRLRERHRRATLRQDEATDAP